MLSKLSQLSATAALACISYWDSIVALLSLSSRTGN
jgi:hypothetical protein